jgi:hypothetical protein
MDAAGGLQTRERGYLRVVSGIVCKEYCIYLVFASVWLPSCWIERREEWALMGDGLLTLSRDLGGGGVYEYIRIAEALEQGF